ncbi:MAG: helix-turn-helix transcriptional regulator [Candidatus Limnocylindria bacterium]
MVRAIGREVRTLRMAANLSQAQLSAAAGISRTYLCRLELGRVAGVDLRVACILFAILGQRLTVKGWPVGEPLRDVGQLKLLDRFDARVPPIWRRTRESVMPIHGDLRAWDERLDGPASIGVEAETRPNDLQAVERAMSAKKRDSRVLRMALLVSATERNSALIRANLPALRQTFPLDTRTFMASIRDGRDPGADGLVLL